MSEDSTIPEDKALEYRIRVRPARKRNEDLRTAIEQLAIDHGWEAVTRETVLDSHAAYLKQRRHPGRPSQSHDHTMHIWLAIEIVKRLRNLPSVQSAVQSMFRESRNKPWLIDVGSRDHFSLTNPQTARTKHTTARRLMRGNAALEDKWTRRRSDALAFYDHHSAWVKSFSARLRVK